MIQSLSENHYGVLQQDEVESQFDYAVECIQTRGYAVVPNVLSEIEVGILRELVDRADTEARRELGQLGLDSPDEASTIRAPLVYYEEFLTLVAANSQVLALVDKFLGGDRGFFELNQQNIVINRPDSMHRQGNWHRDYPYLGVVADKPVGLSCVTCLSDLTAENGGTWILPYSHHWSDTPSDTYVSEQAVQMEARAGSAVVFNSLLWHRTGNNHTDKERIIVNTMYSNPLLKQQISIPDALAAADRRYDSCFDSLLGYRAIPARSAIEFLRKRLPACDSPDE